MRYKVETISPAKAIEWLKRNVNNRSKRKTHVVYLAGMMTAEEWVVNGESIKFDVKGNLIDGQHRLMAVVLSGASIKSLVVRELPASNLMSSDVSVASTVDGGCPRTLNDHFSWRGLKNSATLSVATRWLFIVSQVSDGLRPRTNVKFTRTMADKVLEESPGLIQVVETVLGHGKFVPISKAMASALYYRCGQIDAPLAETFWSGALSGENSNKSMPEFILRQKFEENRRSQQKQHSTTLIAFTIKAWNAKRKGKRITTLRFGVGEDFPTFQ